MTSRKALILTAIALIVFVAGLLLSQHETAPGGTKQAGALYPDLKTQLDAVTAVRIFKAGDARTVELVRQGNDWAVSERAGYRAEQTKVRHLLLALADARPVEQKTSNPESYPALGVEDVSKPDAGGVRVE